MTSAFASPTSLRLSRSRHAPSLGLRRPLQTLQMVASATSRKRQIPVSLNTPGPGGEPTSRVKVVIEAPERNKRKVAASILINAPLDIAWGLLSDYNRLAEYIPNLAVSDLKPHPRGGIRVKQCGAQSILGFEFRASLVMDMIEVNGGSEEWRAIKFNMVDSRDFKQFDGVWKLQSLNGKTALYYEVNIVPRGLVPVRAIEWRISEDVPGNMDAVRIECERRRRIVLMERRREHMTRGES